MPRMLQGRYRYGNHSGTSRSSRTQDACSEMQGSGALWCLLRLLNSNGLLTRVLARAPAVHSSPCDTRWHLMNSSSSLP